MNRERAVRHRIRKGVMVYAKHRNRTVRRSRQDLGRQVLSPRFVRLALVLFTPEPRSVVALRYR